LDKSTDTRERLNEATDFELTIKQGKLQGRSDGGEAGGRPARHLGGAQNSCP